MNIRPVRGTAQGEKSHGFFFDFYEQWSGLFSPTCNWYDFTLIKICGEYARYSGRWELEIALLGMQATVTYVFSDAFNRDMREKLSEITSCEHEFGEPHDDGLGLGRTCAKCRCFEMAPPETVDGNK